MSFIKVTFMVEVDSNERKPSEIVNEMTFALDHPDIKDAWVEDYKPVVKRKEKLYAESTY